MTWFALSGDPLLRLLDILSVHLCIAVSVPQLDDAIWSAFDLPLKLLNPLTLSLILSRSFSHSASRCLFNLHLLLSKIQFKQAFSLDAGVTTGVTSHAAQWVYRMVRVPRDLDCTRVHWRSLLPWSKSVWRQPQFSIWITRETLRDHNETRMGDTKQIDYDEWKDVMPRNGWSLVVQLSCFRRSSLISHQLHLKSLNSSVRSLTSFVLDSSFKLRNPSTKWQSPSQIWRVKQQNHAFLANWINSALSFHYFV